MTDREVEVTGAKLAEMVRVNRSNRHRAKTWPWYRNNIRFVRILCVWVLWLVAMASGAAWSLWSMPSGWWWMMEDYPVHTLVLWSCASVATVAVFPTAPLAMEQMRWNRRFDGLNRRLWAATELVAERWPCVDDMPPEVSDRLKMAIRQYDSMVHASNRASSYTVDGRALYNKDDASWDGLCSRWDREGLEASLNYLFDYLSGSMGPPERYCGRGWSD